MLKFNENWGPMSGGSRKPPKRMSFADYEPIEDALVKAKIEAAKNKCTVRFNIKGVEIDVNPDSNLQTIKSDYEKKLRVKKEHWRNYWKEKNKDPDYEMNNVSLYAWEHGMSYQEAEYDYKKTTKAVVAELLKPTKKEENPTNPPKTANSFEEFLKMSDEGNNDVKFNKGDFIYDYAFRMKGEVIDIKLNKEDPYLVHFQDGTTIWLDGDGLVLAEKSGESESDNDKTEVIGVPSGEVIFMTKKQLEYFVSRYYLNYYDTYVAEIDGKRVKIQLNAYVFHDKDCNDIKDMLEFERW